MPSNDQPKVVPSSAVSPAIEAFIARWSPSGGGECSNYQIFLAELCNVPGVPKHDPALADAQPVEKSLSRDCFASPLQQECPRAF